MSKAFSSPQLENVALSLQRLTFKEMQAFAAVAFAAASNCSTVEGFALRLVDQMENLVPIHTISVSIKREM